MIEADISLANEQNKLEIDEERIYNSALKMLKYALNNQNILSLSKVNQDVSRDLRFYIDVVLCDDDQIQELNKDYRKIDKPTDVLSFALFADNPETQLILDNNVSLGEVIISLETAQKQSAENSKTFEEEVNFLLSHGILHLLGFDHQDEESLEFMLKLQDKLINAL